MSSLYTAVWPEEEYTCYQLESPDRKEMIWGYAKRDSDVGKFLRSIFRNGGIMDYAVDQIPMTVKLVPGPAGSLPNQWLIEDVIHRDWIDM